MRSYLKPVWVGSRVIPRRLFVGTTEGMVMGRLATFGLPLPDGTQARKRPNRPDNPLLRRLRPLEKAA